MIKWIRPSGSEIETNELKETIAACEKMGWKRKQGIVEKNEEAKKKAGRPKKDN